MRFVIQCLTAAVLFVGPASLAQATCPTFSYGHGGYSYAPTYHAPYVEKVIEKRVVVLEYVPTYAVGYAPVVAAPVAVVPQVTAGTPCDTKLAALEAKFSVLEAKLSGSVQTPAHQPPAVAVPSAGKSMLVARCAACHDAAVASTKGGKLSLSDRGNPLALTPELVGKVMKEVSRGAMPKGGKLADSDLNGLIQELFEMSAK